MRDTKSLFNTAKNATIKHTDSKSVYEFVIKTWKCYMVLHETPRKNSDETKTLLIKEAISLFSATVPDKIKERYIRFDFFPRYLIDEITKQANDLVEDVAKKSAIHNTTELINACDRIIVKYYSTDVFEATKKHCC